MRGLRSYVALLICFIYFGCVICEDSSGDYVFADFHTLTSDTLGRSQSAMGISSSEMTILSGSVGSGIYYDIRVFNFKTGNWSLPADKRYSRSDSCYVQNQNSDLLWLYGGKNASNGGPPYIYDRAMISYNVSSSERPYYDVSELKYLPAAGMACAIVNDTIYVYGGGPNVGDYSNSLFSFNTTNHSWHNVTQHNDGPPLEGASMVISGSHLIVFGGRSSNGFSNSTWYFSLDHNNWTEVKQTEDKVESRRYHTAVLSDNGVPTMLVFGGQRSNLTAIGDTWAYFIDNSTWTRLHFDKQPNPRWSHAAMFYNGRMLLFGGTNETTPQAPHVFADTWQLVPEITCSTLSCFDCVKVPGCGWCISSELCMTGDSTLGPYIGSCLPSNFTIESTHCTISTWGFSVWWITFAIVLLFSGAGFYVLLYSKLCKKPEHTTIQ